MKGVAMLVAILAVFSTFTLYAIAVYFRWKSMQPIDPMSGTEYGSREAILRKRQKKTSIFFGYLAYGSLVIGLGFGVRSFFI